MMTREEQLQNALTMLKSAMLAEQRALVSQDYAKGSSRLRRAELAQIGQRVKFWQSEVDRLSGVSRVVVRQVIPRST